MSMTFFNWRRLTNLLSFVIITMLVFSAISVPFSAIVANAQVSDSSISLNPTSGLAGEIVTISGFGFEPETSVSIYVDDSFTGYGNSTNSDGNFEFDFIFPPSSVGEHVVRAIDGFSNEASEIYTVEIPDFTINPDLGPAGAIVTASGNTAPDSTISIYYDDSFSGYSGLSDSTGNFEFTFIPPPSEVGDHVVAMVDNYGNEADQTYAVQIPTFTIDPSSGPAGEPVTVTGAGFAADTSVNIYFDESFSGYSDATDSSGNFEFSIIIPPSAVGDHLVTATDGYNNQASQTYATATPVFSIIPSTGLAGQYITASGNTAPNSVVYIYYDESYTGYTAESDLSGHFEIIFRPPPSEVGDHSVMASDGYSNQQFATYSVVAPNFSINPVSGPAGAQVIVSGDAAPDSAVYIYYDGGYTGYNTGSNSDGNFELAFIVPPSSTGAHNVTASDDYNNAANRTFTVQSPVLTILPTSGPAGTVLTVTGAGFVPDGSVAVYYDDSYYGIYGATDSNGDFELLFTIPSSSVGDHTIKAEDSYGNHASQTFTLTVPTLPIDPTSGPVDETVTVSGSGFTPNSSVTINYDDSYTIFLGFINSLGNFEFSFAIPSSEDGQHQITAIDSYNNQASQTFTVESGISISIPAQNSQVETNTPTISGITQPGSTVTVHEGEMTLGTTTSDESGSWSITSTSLSDGTHTIIATATAGESSSDSSVRTFSVDTRPPVVVASPGQGTYASGQYVTLTASEPATIYYTADGSEPSTSSSHGSSPITGISIPFTSTLKFFAIDVAGNKGSVGTQEYTINTDNAPVADAGADQAASEGSLVTLNGDASSDPDGSIAEYSWSQTVGPSVELSSTSEANPTFTALAVSSDTTLTFSLVVTDDSGMASDPDSVDVIILNDGNFIFQSSPESLPSVTQGDTSQPLTVSVSSPAEKSVPTTRITLAGLGGGMTAEWSTDGNYRSFDTPLELSPGLGETLTASIIIHTSSTTPSAGYTLQVTALGIDERGQAETRSVNLVVLPSEQTVAAITASPSSGEAGDSISLGGSGFTPDSTIDRITLGASGQKGHTSIRPEGQIAVNQYGQWGVESLSLPSDILPGTYVIKAVDSHSKIAQTTFVVTGPEASFDVSLSSDALAIELGDSDGANLAMDIKSVHGFSDPLQLTVSNLPSGLNVFYFDSEGGLISEFSGSPSGNIVTGDPIVSPLPDGTLAITIKINAESSTPAGSYSVFLGATDESGDSRARLIAVTTSSPGVPAMTFSPSTAQPGDTINIQGLNFGSAETVTIQFNGLNSGTNGFNVTPSTIVTAGDGSFSALFTVPGLDGGIYQIKASSPGHQAFSTFQLQPIVDNPTVQLQIAPKAIIVPAGSSGDQTVTVVPIGIFSSNLELTATPEQSGLESVTFLPTNVLAISPGTASPAGMRVSASAGTTPGALIPVRVDARVDGNIIATEHAFVRVSDPGGDFFLSTSPVDLVSARDATVTSTLKIVTTGLAGSPTLSLSGLPDGMDAQIIDVTSTDSAGTATATIELHVSDNADLGTASFTVHASFAGHAEKQLPMSISVTRVSPILVESGVFDPTTLTQDTPLHLTFPFGDGELALTIYSLATNTYGSTHIGYLSLPDTPNADIGLSGFDLLGDGANMDSENPFLNVSYDIRITVPGTPADELRIAFLDATHNPPVWTPLSTFPCDDNSVCSTGVAHFSSWGILAAATSSSIGGGNDNSGHHQGSGSRSAVQQSQATDAAIPETHETGSEPETSDNLSDQYLFDLPEDRGVRSDVIITLGDKPEDDSAIEVTPGAGETHRDNSDANTLYVDGWKVQFHLVSVNPLAKLFEPSARVSILFDVEPEDSNAAAIDGNTIKINYYLIDDQSNTVSSGEFTVSGNSDFNEVVHKKVDVIAKFAGTYRLKLIATTIVGSADNKVEKTGDSNIDVPWIAVNTPLMVEASLVAAGTIVGFVVLSKSHTKPTLGFIRINFSLYTVVITVAGLMLISAFFIMFAGNSAAREEAGMWVANITASAAAILGLILFSKHRSGPHSKVHAALAIGLVLWLGSRIIETWFNAIIPTLLSEEELHHVYPGDFLLTFVTPGDLEILEEAFGGSFGLIYGLFTALKIGGFSFFNYHLFKASKLFESRSSKKLAIAATMAPAIFLTIISIAYLDVLLNQIVLPDLVVHFGYVISISTMMVPSTMLLVVLRKDTKKYLFWVLSSLSLLSFVIAYSWQAFVPVGPNPEQYLDWLEQNGWLSALLFGGDYLLMAFALIWEIRASKKEHHEKIQNDGQQAN